MRVSLIQDAIGRVWMRMGECSFTDVEAEPLKP